MKIVIIGTSAFGLRCLQTCHDLDDLYVTGVVTAPQKFSISYRPGGVSNVLHADVAGFAISHGIPLLTLEQSMNEQNMSETVMKWKPDAFLVAGWYHMVPKRWRDLAPAYGLHASLLPDYSGGAPLVWAMIKGESKTGITLFQMDDGVDSGPIVGQAQEFIYDDDTIATLYKRIEERGLELLTMYLPKLSEGIARLEVQDESKRRIFPQRGPEDGLIDWHWSSRDIYNFVRAQTRPYPGAFTTWEGRQIMIWRSSVVKNEQGKALPVGQVLSDGDITLVNTGNGIVKIDEAHYEQKDISGTKLKRIVGGGAMLGT